MIINFEWSRFLLKAKHAREHGPLGFVTVAPAFESF